MSYQAILSMVIINIIAIRFVTMSMFCLMAEEIDIEFETEEQCRAEIDRIKEIASKALVEK